MAKAKPTIRVVRVIQDSADATRDYWLPAARAAQLNLPKISVYTGEWSLFDPSGQFFRERVPMR